MGQYYTPVEIVSLDDGTHFVINSFSCQVKGLEYNGVKLMEHSWWGNDFLANFCARLYEKSRENNHETHILWLGDYADLNCLSSLDGLSVCFAGVARRSWLKQALQDPNRKEIDIDNTDPDFSLMNKFLVNTTKQEFVNCTTYYNCNHDADDWCIHPLPLLTVVGNGEGGGDYFGVNNELVGRWAGDALYIDDEEPVEPFKEIFPIFREKWQNFKV